MNDSFLFVATALPGGSVELRRRRHRSEADVGSLEYVPNVITG
jgi:hypothetical protein